MADYDASEQVQSFCLHRGAAGFEEWCGIEFGFADDSSILLAYSTGSLGKLEDELTASILRCRSAAEPVARTPWPPRALQAPRATGPAVLQAGVRVWKVSLFEALDGQSVLICFDHPDGTQTRAAFTLSAAQMFVAKVRDEIAYPHAS